jgi:hypothetical protein
MSNISNLTEWEWFRKRTEPTALSKRRGNDGARFDTDFAREDVAS